MSSGRLIRKNLESQHLITFKDHPCKPETENPARLTVHATGASASRHLLVSIKRHTSRRRKCCTPQQKAELTLINPNKLHSLLGIILRLYTITKSSALRDPSQDIDNRMDVLPDVGLRAGQDQELL